MGCAKLKNVCQTCMLDLEYGLPIQVRDAALKVKDDLPKSDVNREYYLQNVDSQLASSDTVGPGGALGKLPSHKSELLAKLARTTPYYKRNRPHICSFWVKGECKRGEECPYRHEEPTDPDDPLSNQNIKDRYYGINDPVAEKLLKRASAMPHLDPPEDKMITTLYCGGLDEGVTEQDIKNAFYAYGETPAISIGSDLPIEMVPGHLPAPPIEVTKNYFGLAAPGPSGGFMNLPSSLPAAPMGGMQY